MRICCHNTEHVHVNGHDRTVLVILAKYCIRRPDDETFVIRNMLEQFKYFIILIVSTNYIFVHLLDYKLFNILMMFLCCCFFTKYKYTLTHGYETYKLRFGV